MKAPAGSLVAYATAPGSISADGTGKHGIYTGFLLDNMKKPGLTIEQVFKNVRRSVRKATNNRQIPWENSSLTGDFYFAGSGTEQKKVTRPAAPAPVPAAVGSIRITTTPDKARIWIDDGYEGRSPLSISSLKPGLISVRVGKSGYEPQQEKFRIRAGRQSELSFILARKALPPGRLSITVDPSNALIRFADREIRYSRGMALPAGRYPVEISKTGYSAVSLTLEVIAGRETRTTITLRKIKQEKPAAPEVAAPLRKSEKTTAHPEQSTEPESMKNPGWLTVQPEPQDARIRILNILPVYRAGMALAPGQYQIEVARYGYGKKIQWVALDAGQRKTVSIALVKAESVNKKNTVKSGHLTVVPVPWNARVRILNNDAIYRPGIPLHPGNYHIEVSHKKYRTRTQWVNLENGESKNLIIDLIRETTTGNRNNRTRNSNSNGYLTILPHPENAQVRILNNQAVYKKGVTLKPGHYHIEVSCRGYRTQTQWVVIEAGENKQLTMTLRRVGSRQDDNWAD